MESNHISDRRCLNIRLIVYGCFHNCAFTIRVPACFPYLHVRPTHSFTHGLSGKAQLKVSYTMRKLNLSF